MVNDELPCKGVKGLAEIKKVIAGEAITVEAKGMRPKSIKNQAKIIFAGNQLPILAEPDAGGAFSSRLCVLKLLQAPTLGERDVELINKLFEERHYIFSLAVDAFKNMRTRALTFSPDPVGDGMVASYRFEPL